MKPSNSFDSALRSSVTDPSGWSVLVDSRLTPMLRVWNIVGVAGTTLVSCPMSQTDTEGKIDSSTDQK
jgi:hypothetical protein